MRPYGSPEQLEQRRRKALALLDDGWRPVDVAEQLGVERRSVRRWRARARPVAVRPRWRRGSGHGWNVRCCAGRKRRGLQRICGLVRAS